MSTNTNTQVGRPAWRRLLLRHWPIAVGVLVALLLVGAGSFGTIVMQHIMNAGKDRVVVVGFHDWRVICPPPSQKNVNCVLNMDVTRDQGGILLRLSLGDVTSDTMLSITVPHGVLLDQGLGFSVANSDVKIRPYETCDTMGCLAILNLDEQTLKTLQTSANGKVIVMPANGGKSVAIPFSLNGFADGFAELERERSSRAFWSFLD